MTMQQQNPDAVEIELDDVPSKIVPMPQPKPQAPQAPVSPIPGMLARIAAAFGITELLALVPAISALVSINAALRDQLQAAFKAKRSDIWARAMPYVSGLFYHMARNWAPAIQELPNPVVAVQAAVLDVLTDPLDFGAIASEASSNASVQASGSLAGGTMAGVGFTTAQGYITALANGVKRATADQYLMTLRTRYGMTQDAIEALAVTIIAESALPVGAGITHIPTGPDIFSRPRAERLAHMGAAQAKAVTEPVARPVLTHGNIVAGADLNGSGVMLGWMGAGETTLAIIKARLTAAGCPESWAPASKSAVAHVGFALQPLTAGGNVVRSDRGGRKRGDRVASTDGRMRGFMGRWIVLTPQTRGDVGDHAGQITMTAVLFTDGRLELTGPREACDKVQADYLRRMEHEAFPAAEVTLWLRDTLRRQFAAVRLGGCWYVPNRYAAKAEALCNAIAQSWGSDWMLPGLPIATSEQLLAGIVNGLAGEVSDLLRDLDASKEQAKKQGQSQLGARGAASFLRRLREVNERAKGYATLLGPTHVAAIRTEISGALSEIEPLCDDTAERFAMLDLD